LLTSHPFDAGEHEIAWDAQTNGIYLTPGELVDAGEYRWEAIYHEGFELTLRGWASHGGSHPWNNGKGTGWGGDHGTPHTLATDGRRVYLGWTAAEAGRAIVATDLTGQVQWRLPIGQSNCTHLATDGRTVFAFNPRPGVLYRLDAAEGFYTAFGDDDRGTISVGELFGGEAVKHIDGLAAGDGKLYLAAAARDTVVVLDAESGEKLKAIGAPKPGRMHLADDGMLYVVSDGKAVHRVDPESGKTDMLFDGLSEATSVFRHTDGRLLVSVMGDEHRVLVFSDRGERLGAIGQASAGREIGPFNPLAMANPTQCLVDAEGKLWVTESNEHPKRVSVWSIDDGGLLAEHYGPTHYGASGGAIHPADPNVMVGAACEWKLDPDTGRATCTYVIDHHSHGYATFRQGDNGRWYLLTNSGRYGTTRLQVRERTDEGRYVLRATIAGNPQGEGRYKPSRIWADANGDGEPQDSEYMHHTHWLHLAGSNNWSLCIGRDMTLYPYDMGRKQVVALPVSGFTAAGAPVYDPAKIVELPLKHDAEFQMNYSGAAGGDGGKRVLINHGGSGLPNPFDFIWQCFDTESGQLLWSYPNPYFQVHRSHTAPSPQIGLFRGAFGIVGIADYPEPIGTVWVINGNLGEWHMLTEDGYYLSRLFQGDPLKVRFPDVAVPGADMTNAPPGLGGEDFGGSMTQGEDGRMYVQAGKTALWNLRVDGFDKVKPLGSGELTLTQPLLAEAAKLREAQLQAAEGTGAVTIGRRTIRFTGNPAADFQGVKPVSFEKNRGAGVEVWSAWDDEHLYVAWGVQDNTPWVNGAGHAREMYASGDTVDLQLGPAADGGKRGNNRVLGDLRLSIGPFQDKPTAVIYRKVWNEKKPYSVSSGVVENYTLDYAAVVEDVQIEQTTGKGRYVVEAAIPWDVLGFKPELGHELVGDFGTTHGNPSGNRTRLRTYWNNKQTGLVDDVVYFDLGPPE